VSECNEEAGGSRDEDMVAVNPHGAVLKKKGFSLTVMAVFTIVA
jgi:hypothetical protein